MLTFNWHKIKVEAYNVEFSPLDVTHAGCSLKLILDWAWDRVVDIKDQLDQLCKNFILDHHNLLLVDSFKRMERVYTVHFPKMYYLIRNVTGGKWKY